VQQAESSASRIRQQGSAQDDGDAQGHEASVHTGGTVGQPANQGRTPVRERILNTRGQAQNGDARNVINARRTSNAEAQVAAGYHPRQGGRYDSREDRSPTPEPLGTRVFSREIRTTSFPQRFHQPTSIDKSTGETNPRVWLNNYRLACQLGSATTNEVIIRNLPLHLADSARTWLEHLPPSQIHNWDDLVRTFVGNFQGTYVCLGNSWDLRACTQKHGESLRDFKRCFSKRSSVRDRAYLPRGYDLPGPCARAWAKPAGRLQQAVRHRHQFCFRRGGGGGPSSTARRASAWTTRPRWAASPKTPIRSTTGQEASP
jgi:hypothetical protein